MNITKLEFLATNTSDNITQEMLSTIVGNDSHEITQDNPINVDWTMGLQRIIVHNILNSFIKANSNYDYRPQVLDIGSAFEMITYFASFSDVSYLEPRWKHGVCLAIPGVGSMRSFCGEAQKLPFDNETFDIVVSLHAIEHFGLGRYGDTLDAQGDIKGISEMARTLKKGGKLITSVPTLSKSRLDWPEQRIYSPSYFRKLTDSVGLKSEVQVVTYAPGHPHNICLGDGTTDLEAWPQNWTPAVLINILSKE